MDTTNPAPSVPSANSENVNKNAVRKWTWTIVRLVVLAFLITGVVDVIMVAGKVFLRTIRSPNPDSVLTKPITNYVQPANFSYTSVYGLLDGEPALATTAIIYKRLQIDVDGEGLTATYDLYLPKNHPLFSLVDVNNGNPEVQKLVDEVLGGLSVSRDSLRFNHLETAIVESDINAHILVKSEKIKPKPNPYQVFVHAKQRGLPLAIERKEVQVFTRDVTVHSAIVSPVSKTADKTVYVIPADQDQTVFFVELLNTPTTLDHQAETRPTLGEVMQRPPQIPWIHNAMSGLLEAIPFLLFLYWIARGNFTATEPPTKLRVDAIKIYLGLHFSYFFFYALSDLINEWQSPFLWALNFFESRTLYVFREPNFRSTNLLLPMMVMFLYVWPALARPVIADDDRLEPVRKKGGTVFAFLVLVVLVVVVGWLLIRNFDTLNDPDTLTVVDYYSLFFSSALLILYVLCLLLAQATQHTWRWRLGLGTFALLVFLTAADSLYPFANFAGGKSKQINAVFSVLIFALTAFSLVRVFASLGYQAATGRILRTNWKALSRRKRWLLFLLLLLIAVSTRSWSWPMQYWPLWSLSWELKHLFLVALVGLLVSYLHSMSSEHDWLNLPEAARDAGVLLALSLFYSPTAHWKYVPVTYIVGALLLRLWLLPKTQFDRSLFVTTKSRIVRTIERIIDYNDAEKALKTMKKDLIGQLGKGEIEPDDYAAKLDAQAKKVKSIRKELTTNNRFAKDLVLAFGPGDSAWENGKKAALYSLLFALPWSVLYLRNMASAEITGASYVFLDVINSVTYFTLAWLSYGFIFGYFYPHIRGSNGIQKGLSLFLTIVAPELVLNALRSPLDTTSWSSLTFWTMQIFVHTMLLGMIVGDFAIMRLHGFKWSQLLEFYRLTSLSAWVSSVLLAIAAVVSTLITSGAGQIITMALKFLGAIPDDIDLPTTNEGTGS